MKPLEQSGVCASRVHCRTCRDRTGGRRWRLSLAGKLALPAGAPDFECPFGFAWGVDTLPVAELTDEQIEEERRRIAAGGCCGEPSQ